MRNIVFSDCHGCGLELEEFLDKIAPDRIISAGDNFDRALHADIVWKLIHRHNIPSVIGNHEMKMMQFLEGRREYLPVHYYVAMNILFERAGVAPNELLAYLKSLPLLIDFGKWMVVHAGVIIDNPLKEDISMNVYGNLPSDRRMPRPKDSDSGYWWDKYQGDKCVIYGHLVTSDNLPRLRWNKRGQVNSIGIDTAACHGGNLTVCEIIEDGETIDYRFHSVKCRDWNTELKENYRGTILNGVYQEFVNNNRQVVKEGLAVKE